MACSYSESCEFYHTVERNIRLRLKYAFAYPYCKGSRDDQCAIAKLVRDGGPVPEDLLPDGSRDPYRSGAYTPTASAVRTGADYVVVEDSPVFATIAANAIRQHFPGADVKTCRTFDEAVRAIDTHTTRLVVSGYGVGDGKTVLDIRRHTPAPILIFTGRPTEDRELPERSHIVMKGAGPDALHVAMDALLGV